MSLRVLMIGWEFPPHISGGLGVACKGLTDALADHELNITFVLPRSQDVDGDGRIRFVFADVPSDVAETRGVYSTTSGNSFDYSLPSEIYSYADQVREIARRENFDVIHAHDWNTYLSGMAAKEVSGKPLILHVHITASDFAGGDGGDERIVAIERAAFQYADALVTVSQRVKDSIVKRYDLDPDKVHVVYNGVDFVDPDGIPSELTDLKAKGYKIVLSLGRISLQKGIDYFVQAAARVLEYDDKVMFVIVGGGDMFTQIVSQVHDLGIGKNVLFTGWVKGDIRWSIFKAADLFVMPSLSEPFGLVALEAAGYDTPVIVSKQSGASEVMSSALKVDFWDVDEMANQIFSILHHKPLHKEMMVHGKKDAMNTTWHKAAIKCKDLYHRIVG